MLLQINAGSNIYENAAALTRDQFRAMQAQIKQAIKEHAPQLEPIAEGEYFCKVWKEHSFFSLLNIGDPEPAQIEEMKSQLIEIRKRWKQDSIALTLTETTQNELI